MGESDPMFVLSSSSSSSSSYLSMKNAEISRSFLDVAASMHSTTGGPDEGWGYMQGGYSQHTDSIPKTAYRAACVMRHSLACFQVVAVLQKLVGRPKPLESYARPQVDIFLGSVSLRLLV